MEIFQLAALVAQHDQAGRPYLEFLRHPSLSLGLYRLPAGATDPQRPHTEDEVYLIVAGKGMIHVDGEDRDIEAGSLVYVPAGARHYFHTISAELTLVVLFAPAENALAPDRSRRPT